MKPKIPVPDREADLITCRKHGVMFMGEDRACPSCELDIEARPAIYPFREGVSDIEFRNRIERDTMWTLVPIMKEYLASMGQPTPWIACPSWPKKIPLPSGYNETERFFNAFVYVFGSRQKAITTEAAAQETIKALTAAGYGRKSK